MPRPRTHDDALRVRLLEVTSQVVSTRGPAAVTVRDVAARAGTSASAVYALLGSKDALLQGALDEAYLRFAAHLGRVPRTDSPADDLLELGLAYRHSALGDPHFYRVMFGGWAPAGPTATSQPTFAVLRDGVARLGGTDPEEAAIVLWGLVHGLVSLELAGLLPGDADAREQRFAIALRTAGAGALSR